MRCVRPEAIASLLAPKREVPPIFLATTVHFFSRGNCGRPGLQGNDPTQVPYKVSERRASRKSAPELRTLFYGLVLVHCFTCRRRNQRCADGRHRKAKDSGDKSLFPQLSFLARMTLFSETRLGVFAATKQAGEWNFSPDTGGALVFEGSLPSNDNDFTKVGGPLKGQANDLLSAAL